MARFALLILPSANRIYTDSSVDLTSAELAVFNQSVLDGRLSDIAESPIGGVRHVMFTCDGLDDKEAAFLANLSSIYTLYEVQGAFLRPIELRGLERFDDDLITTQRYVGKTNEQFTKLLLNVTLLSSAFAREMLDRKFKVMDPLCGRGTTLNQALMYGYDAAGVDLDSKDFAAYSTFMETWLKRKRIKHQAEFAPVRHNRQLVARRLHITFGATKEQYKAGNTQEITVVNADTTKARDFFRAASFDLLVADAPYGVQHGSRSVHKGLTRTPLDLLSGAAPTWAALLRPGGALGISWNTLVARREDAAAILEHAGLQVLTADPYLGFKHRVDQAIVRDVIVARKP